jgi:acetylornithine/N-succinyldiaminopimelate aminotransferase
MLDVAALMEITSRPEPVFVRGRGSWLWDSRGVKYLDFIQGWAVNCLGHCAPAVVEAICAQAATLINCSPAFYNAPMLRLAGLITRHSGLDRVFFANSGAEANEGAIKLVRKYGQLHRHGAYQIITMEHAFHGRTLATMSASGKPGWDTLFEPKVPGFQRVPLGDLEALAQAITRDTVAVMLEPIQGESGVVPADDAYMRAVRELTQREGVLLILDEIQTGIGRTGRLFAHQHCGVLPDIMTLGKGLGSGVPLTALVAREEVCCFEPGDQGGTFNGNPLMSAVGCAVLDTVTAPGFLEDVREQGTCLQQRLEQLSARFGFGTVRGRGLLLALDLKQEMAHAVVDRALEGGLLLNAPRPDTLRFMPSLTVSAAEIDAMIAILESICSALTGADPV